MANFILWAKPTRPRVQQPIVDAWAVQHGPETIPEFPPNVDWLGPPFVRVANELGRHAFLIEFFDSARINSLRTLPYLKGWHARYTDSGLLTLGVHSPGYSFGRLPAVATAAIADLEIPYPVALDPALEVWRIYANRGWPARYLFDRRGVRRLLHYGEGEYEATELTIQTLLAELDEGFAPPEPLSPLRPEDEPGVTLVPQTADIALPADRERLELTGSWNDGPDYIEAAAAGVTARASFRAGAAFAVISGDDESPGLRETNGLVSATAPGLRLHGFQFTPLADGI